MDRNAIYNDVNDALPHLCRIVLDGPTLPSRNGAVHEQTFMGVTLRNPLNREILVEGRKANLAAQIAETMWVLSGRNDVEFLSHYLPRAKDFSDDGATWRGGYGPRIRAWNGEACDVDQVAHVVALLKKDPATRQAVISIYDPGVDTNPGKDIPCNNWLHFLARDGVLDLHAVIRSNDLIWGWSGINQFEWSVLLELVARATRLKVGSLHFSISSLHVYEPHWDKATRLAEGSTTRRGAVYSPRLQVKSLEDFDRLSDRWFAVEQAIRTGADVNHSINTFPDDMLRVWLRVLQWWWTGDESHLPGTNVLSAAALVALQPPDRTPAPNPVSEFATFVSDLHAQKDAAYGDSWCRRGEMLGIMANIARKIDRLGGGASTPDETQTDTAIDLLVYLVKYRFWLAEETGLEVPGSVGSDSHVDAVARHLRFLADHRPDVMMTDAGRVSYLDEAFTALETVVVSKSFNQRVERVQNMIWVAWALAEARWTRQRDEYRGADHD